MTKGIRQRGNSFLWDITVSGKRITGTAKTFEEALKAREEAKKSLQSGVPVTSVNLDRAYKKALENWERNCGNSIRTIKINASEVLDYFGGKTKVTEIDKARIEGFVRMLESKGNSPATINRKLSVLSKILKTAVEEGYLETLPRIPRMKEGKGRIRFLTSQEEKALLELLKRWGKDDHADAVAILLDTGIRTGELFRMEKRDILIKNGKPLSVSIWRTKNGHPRTQPLTERASKILKRRMEGLGEEDRIFPYDQWWLRACWDRAKVALGMEDDDQFVPHILRHTCASRLAQRGVPLPVIKEYMGHTSIQTTMRYAHLATDSLRMAVQALEREGETAA